MKISRYPVFLIVSLIIIFNSGFSQNIVVNEIMSSNKTTILDEDGDTPDWIEFFNPGNEPVNLAGYGLTDDTADLYKWIFPERTIDPQGYLLAFASGKNRTGQGQWETIINWGDNWRYFVPQEELPVNWRLPDFDDSGWDTGPSGFGYGDDDDATIIDPTMSVFIRKTFSVADLPEILDAVLHVDYDDGFVAYLNGQEIARANLGIPGIIPAFDLPATNVIEPLIYQGGYPGAFTVDPALLSPDINVLAIEVHNFDITSSDLTLIPFFSLLFASPPPNPSGTHPLLQLINPKLHTNFKISSSGENILLTSTSGVPVDYLQTGSLPADVSIGRQPDGSLNWVYFNEATPELPIHKAGRELLKQWHFHCLPDFILTVFLFHCPPRIRKISSIIPQMAVNQIYNRQFINIRSISLKLLWSGP